MPVIDGEVYYTRQIWRGFGAGTEYTYFIFSENDYVEPVTYGGFTQNSYKNCYNTGLAYAFNDINGLKELRLPNALKNVGEGILLRHAARERHPAGRNAQDRCLGFLQLDTA